MSLAENIPIANGGRYYLPSAVEVMLPEPARLKLEALRQERDDAHVLLLAANDKRREAQELKRHAEREQEAARNPRGPVGRGQMRPVAVPPGSSATQAFEHDERPAQQTSAALQRARDELQRANLLSDARHRR